MTHHIPHLFICVSDYNRKNYERPVVTQTSPTEWKECFFTDIQGQKCGKYLDANVGESWYRRHL